MKDPPGSKARGSHTPTAGGRHKKLAPIEGGAVVPYNGGAQNNTTSGTSTSSAIIGSSNGGPTNTSNSAAGVTGTGGTGGGGGNGSTANQALVVGGGTSSVNVPPILVKRDLVLAVRRIAPASIEPAPTLFRDVTAELKTTTLEDGEVKQQMAIVEEGVNNSARKYNDLRVLCERKRLELKAKLDELESQKLQYEQLCDMKKAKTYESARIEQLKVELDTVSTDLHRLDHQRRQYLHMLQRLNKNQILFDAHMNGMAECYNSVYKEYKEVVLLRRGLDAGLAKTQAVYTLTQSRVAEARSQREAELDQRKGEMKNAMRLKQWLRERVAQKIAMSNIMRGDLTKEEEDFLQMQVRDKEEKTKSLQRTNEENQKRAHVLEQAFLRIKQLIGVASLEEIVEKFHMQRVNKVNIEREVREVEQRLAILKAEYNRQEQHYRDLKSSGHLGGAGDVVTRDMTLHIEDEIVASKNELKVWKAELCRLNHVLVSLQQGGLGLFERTKPYLHLVEGLMISTSNATATAAHGERTATNSSANSVADGYLANRSVSNVSTTLQEERSGAEAAAVPSRLRAESTDALSQQQQPAAVIAEDSAMPEAVWRDTMDMLSSAEHVLSRMLELVAQPGGQSSQALAASAASNLEPGKLAPIPSSFDIFAASFSTKPGVVDPYLRESFSIAKSEGWDLNGDGGVIGNNVRIMSKRTRKALDNRGNDAAASLAVSVAMQGLPSSKFDMDLNDHDKSDSELMLGASAGGGGAAAGGTNASSLDAGIDDFYRGAAGGTTGNQMNNNSIDGGALDGIDAEIMSRMGVKALSVHTTQEFARQKQAKERAEKLAERIRLRNTTDAKGGESALDLAARLKAQQDMADRLCVFKQLPTLPRGCTLKDPPLVKTDHFLTKMPDLV